ncbi:TerB family tellurite resistance protein [Sulfurospirillum barnesii]|uniref:Tellurite resistance protein TerB n=1 Tax=Sulfurospirillum barnesii (strain ATCC 700032 / DSM 10660 / SES-3) TaxID=760154 RepID=I3XWP0_SULBS|nr:TerB family tellurite resistance protein [Sulfurospirillum barnesii]AFL68364.1 Tellurite resistance protein TerB [Sulfurospirillum barnesii SES-3]
MGWFKTMSYIGLGVAGGVAAIAAAPFTGGGSLLGAATLATSLAGAGTIAAATGAAAVAGGTGAYLAKKDDDDDEKKDEKISELALRANKLETGLKKAFQSFEGDKEYFNFIVGMTALGLAMANVDGEISAEEREEIDEFVGGIANSHYPQHVKDSIQQLNENIPNLMTAMKVYISKVNPKNYDVLRDLLKIVMLADGIEHEREIAFISAFEQQILQVEYQPEKIDTKGEFLLTIQANIA